MPTKYPGLPGPDLSLGSLKYWIVRSSHYFEVNDPYVHPSVRSIPPLLRCERLNTAVDVTRHPLSQPSKYLPPKFNKIYIDRITYVVIENY